jgi:MFS family permease
MYCMLGFGVGGNIPIDATITLEFLPKNRRFLLAALSSFQVGPALMPRGLCRLTAQPIGVVVTSVISYGLIPSNSCAADLPACNTGETPCCEKSDNMGWYVLGSYSQVCCRLSSRRYVMIVLGCITLTIFILRFVVFRFRESPKFLLAKGHDIAAIDVVYAIAEYNGAPQPRLTYEDFKALEFEEASRSSINSATPLTARPIAPGEGRSVWQRLTKVAKTGFMTIFGHMRGLFRQKIYTYLFIVLAIA